MGRQRKQTCQTKICWCFINIYEIVWQHNLILQQVFVSFEKLPLNIRFGKSLSNIRFFYCFHSSCLFAGSVHNSWRPCVCVCVCSVSVSESLDSYIINFFFLLFISNYQATPLSVCLVFVIFLDLYINLIKRLLHPKVKVYIFG